MSRESVEAQIKAKHAVLLVPGGQAEMQEVSDDKRIVLVTRHKVCLELYVEWTVHGAEHFLY